MAMAGGGALAGALLALLWLRPAACPMAPGQGVAARTRGPSWERTVDDACMCSRRQLVLRGAQDVGLLALPAGDREVALAGVEAVCGRRVGFERLISILSRGDTRALKYLRRAVRATSDYPPDAGREFDASIDVTSVPDPVVPGSLAESIAVHWRDWLASTSDLALEEFSSSTERCALAEEATWHDYSLALHILQFEGNRVAAAHVLRGALQTWTPRESARGAEDLLEVLDSMTREDEARAGLGSPSSARQGRRIEDLVYSVRDAMARQNSWPGRVDVMEATCSDGLVPAKCLAELGRAAVPRLVEMLNDRRATRCIAFTRPYQRQRTVLRYMDFAIEVLGRIAGVDFYAPPNDATYYSSESGATRIRVRQIAEQWFLEVGDGDDVDRFRATMRLVAPPAKFIALRRMIKSEKLKAIGREALLKCYVDAGYVDWRPEICELLVEMGDDSLLRLTLEEEIAGGAFEVALPERHGDLEATVRRLNKRETVLRLQALAAARAVR